MSEHPVMLDGQCFCKESCLCSLEIFRRSQHTGTRTGIEMNPGTNKSTFYQLKKEKNKCLNK
jgi:hypothetical protein